MAALVTVFREVWRVLRNDGTLWLNLGASYAGSWGNYHPNSPPGKHGQRLKETARWNRPAYHSQEFLPPTAQVKGWKPKDLINIPLLVSEALRQDGWYLRSMIPWLKRNAMSESTEDRPTTGVEYVFLLTKNERYFYDAEAIKKPSVTHDPRRPYMSEGARQLDGRTTWHGGQKRDGDNFSTRSRRTSDWFFESWQGLLSDEGDNPLSFVVNTYPYTEAHFATFPPKLVEPMLLAGTSEKGCCPQCKAPWVRVIEKTTRPAEKPGGKYGAADPQANGHRILANMYARRHAGEPHDNPFPAKKTLGWKPTCTCNAGDPIPCIVFDPFLGSGTSLLVADRQGRHGIGLELNPAYCQMAQRRITQDAPLFMAAPPTPSEEQPSLFTA